jgi:DHA2 family multidrug resistance protein
MQGTLSATQEQMSWVLTSYIIAAAVTIPLTGWLAGRFGRKKVFLISVVGFTIASALCGTATSLGQIVLYRLLQGMSGAALVPLSQAVLFDINKREDYGKAMAIWGIGVTMGPILGPALGGWLTENYSWRWVFYINVPIGILAFLGLSASMPETEQHEHPFDFFGFVSLSAGLAALQLLLDRGQLRDWFSSGEIVVYGIIVGVAFYMFLVHTLTHDRPFLNPALFKDRNFLAGNLFIFLIGVVLFATLALLPPMLQNEMQYPVILTGLVTAPRGAGTMVAMAVVGRLMGWVDGRLLMAIGLALTAFSLWQMTHFSLIMGESHVVISGILQGFGMGLCYVPLSALAFGTLPTALRNEGTAFFSLLRNVGSAVGISIVGVLLTRNTQIVHARLAESITPYGGQAMGYASSHIDTSSRAGLTALNGLITNQAAMIAYIDDFKLMMVLTIAVIPLVIVLKNPPRTAGGHAVID